MRQICFFLSFFFFYSTLFGQSLTVEQYIDAYKSLAVREMKRMGIPASITLAQGILETENGNSDLVRKSNNHFGIKCKSSWSGSSVFHDDDASGECFRKYNTAEDSYRDHSNFLRGSDRYSFLFKLSPTDYKGWAYGLKRAGYATNPAYPNILIKNIEQYNLQQYTLMAINDVPVFDAEKYADTNNITSPIASMNDSSNNILTGNIISGKTLFNGLKAMYALKGASLLAISTANHIALAKLLEFNDLKEAQNNALQLGYLLNYNNFKEDQTIVAGTKVLLKPVLKRETEISSNLKMHEVQPKEGLYGISKKYNVSVEDIRTWNNLSSDELQVGQKLIISK